MNTPEWLERTALVAGDEGMERIMGCRVIIFGVGGVGSWCVEALARTGIGAITMVDPDCVAPSNINRQMPALVSTTGRPKVAVMAERIADINPACRTEALCRSYTAENADTFGIETFDYAIDAIDSLADKAHLILRCTDAATAPRHAFFSSMGAARKVDAGAIAVANFMKVQGCPLARALRTRFRRTGTLPQRPFRCVYSPEPPLPQNPEARASGTFAHVTAAFGLRLTSLVISDLLSAK